MTAFSRPSFGQKQLIFKNNISAFINRTLIPHSTFCTSFQRPASQRPQSMFSCPFCARSFTAKTTLKHHIKLHQGIYRYNCPDCGKGFMSKSMLTGHLSWHTGVKQFKCQLCAKDFRYNQQLKHHYRKEHKFLI